MMKIETLEHGHLSNFKKRLSFLRHLQFTFQEFPRPLKGKDAIEFLFGRNRLVYVCSIAENEHLVTVLKVENSQMKREDGPTIPVLQPHLRVILNSDWNMSHLDIRMFFFPVLRFVVDNQMGNSCLDQFYDRSHD